MGRGPSGHWQILPAAQVPGATLLPPPPQPRCLCQAAPDAAFTSNGFTSPTHFGRWVAAARGWVEKFLKPNPDSAENE